MRKPTSRVKLRACRLNGACSRGPTTEAGKRRSSQNRLSHGRYSQQTLLPAESPEDFADHLDTTIQRFRPATNDQLAVVHQIAAASWKLNRIVATETRIFNQNIPPIQQIWNQEIPENEILHPNHLTIDVDNSPETRILEAHLAACADRRYRTLTSHAESLQSTLHSLYRRLVNLRTKPEKTKILDSNRINDSFILNLDQSWKRTYQS